MVELPSDKANAVIGGVGSSTLCHQRLSHMSGKGMKMLVSNGKIPRLKNVEVGFCELSVLGNQKGLLLRDQGREDAQS